MIPTHGHSTVAGPLTQLNRKQGRIICGIAGFNLSPTSKVNARALSHELLALIEYRGSHASGFGFTQAGQMGVHKNNVPGSQLPLGQMPRRAKSVILHTRYATQGPASDNRNNHPVMSPNATVALVHNGVISNDYKFRKEFDFKLPAVDTSVIPALIERDGLDSVEQLSGYAAIAWLDSKDRKYGDVLHLARLDSSPVAYTWLLDGSFVFASTPEMLELALIALSLEYGHVFAMNEGDYFRIRNGVIMKFRDDLKMQDDWSAWMQYGSSTAGGHGATKSTERAVGSSFGNRAMGSETDLEQDWEYNPATQEWESTYNSWDDDYRSRTGLAADNDDEVAMAMAPETNGIGDPNDPANEQGFWTQDVDDALEFHPTLEELETHLAWLSQLSMHDDTLFPGAERKLRWMNYVKDMGSITVDGGMESWFDDMAGIDEYESPAIRNLNYVREGISNILAFKGS